MTGKTVPGSYFSQNPAISDITAGDGLRERKIPGNGKSLSQQRNIYNSSAIPQARRCLVSAGIGAESDTSDAHTD